MPEQRATQLHHVVFAVAPERQAAVAQMFTELGFSFENTELTELGLTIYLDWNGGVELISAIPGATAEVASSVCEFVKRNGDGVYTVVLRVPEALPPKPSPTATGRKFVSGRAFPVGVRISRKSTCRFSAFR